MTSMTAFSPLHVFKLADFTTTQYFVASVALLVIFTRLCGVRERKKLPPSPPGHFIVGNAFQIPSRFLHWKFTEWSKTYGGIFSIRAMHRQMIILSSAEPIREILDKQGLKTGGRSPLPIYSIIAHPSFLMLSGIDAKPWKIGRRLMRDMLSGPALDRVLPIQELESASLLNDMLKDPQNMRRHIKRATASLAMAIVYGKRCPEYNHTEIERFFTLLYATGMVADPNAHPIVNAFPILNLLPDFLAPWKPPARRLGKEREEFNEALLCHTEDMIRNHLETGCLMEPMLKDPQLSRIELTNLGMALFEAGIASTTATTLLCILAAINYPEFQKKVHDEMDRVVGNHRLPIYSDLENLPYLRAFMEEAQRLRPIVPVGMPHTATQDVSYKEYHIRKNSMIFMNIWGLLNDENMFENPDKFDPERFLKTPYGTKPGVDDKFFRNNFIFGAGRRICPGEPLGRRSVAIFVMRLLWAFEFKKDDSGTGSMDPSAFSPGIESGPKPFSCIVEPRDGNRVTIIKAACGN